VQDQTFTPVGSHTSVKVNTRFICASNRDLQIEVNAGRFRQDLFYRLGVIHIELPPLRERGDDVLLLAEHFLRTLQPNAKSARRLTNDAAERLMQYPWPGNIRELRNAIERTLTLAHGDVIDVDDLPRNVASPTSHAASTPGAESTNETATIQGAEAPSATTNGIGQETLTDVSREEALDVADYQYLVGLLQTHSGNVSEAAKQAGLSRQGMHKLLSKHGLRAADFRE
jgi:DNA-binding NtrC family response regulator